MRAPDLIRQESSSRRKRKPPTRERRGLGKQAAEKRGRPQHSPKSIRRASDLCEGGSLARGRPHTDEADSMFAQQLAGAISHAHSPQQLDQLARDLWRAHASGALSDDEAQAAAESLQRRRGQGVPEVAATWKNASAAFPRARCQRSPDKNRSIERRRRLAMSGPMPPTLACKFTVSELACLRIVSDEIRRHGVCSLHIDAICARAGTCRTTCQNALRAARRLGLLTVEERRRRGQPSLTNLVRIVSAEWRAWLRLGNTGLKKWSTAVIRSSEKERRRGKSFHNGSIRAPGSG
jgi:hypothetical protein